MTPNVLSNFLIRSQHLYQIIQAGAVVGLVEVDVEEGFGEVDRRLAKEELDQQVDPLRPMS
jgi:hypothetical protein